MDTVYLRLRSDSSFEMLGSVACIRSDKRNEGSWRHVETGENEFLELELGGGGTMLITGDRDSLRYDSGCRCIDGRWRFNRVVFGRIR
jgi:hypothetical protein